MPEPQVRQAVATDQIDRDSDAELLASGAESTLITNRVSACTMSYAPGTSQRAGLVSIALAVSDTGETVSLLHQVHVDNVP